MGFNCYKSSAMAETAVKRKGGKDRRGARDGVNSCQILHAPGKRELETKEEEGKKRDPQ